MQNNNDFTDLFRSQISVFQRLKNNLISKTIQAAETKVMSHFGIEMKFTTGVQVGAFSSWVHDLDPDNFSHRIANPYDRNNVESVLSGQFIMKLDEATFMYVSAEPSKPIDQSFVYVYIFGRKMYKWFKKLSEVVQYSPDSNTLYTISATKGDNDNSYWQCIGSSFAPRPMNTLFFDKGIKEMITNHLDDWIKNEPVYSSRGLIFKTGILIHGKAGTGKTSLATAIATYLGCNLISIDPATFKYLNISEVAESINADGRFVILIDEIDTIFASRDDEALTDEQKEKTSKLLSFLDSQQSPNNVVFVATTNYIDRLDKAITRKGRFDLIIELNDIDKQTAMEMCRSFNLNDIQTHEIVDKYPFDHRFNPCELQSKILQTISKKNEDEV